MHMGKAHVPSLPLPALNRARARVRARARKINFKSILECCVKSHTHMYQATHFEASLNTAASETVVIPQYLA